MNKCGKYQILYKENTHAIKIRKRNKDDQASSAKFAGIGLIFIL